MIKASIALGMMATLMSAADYPQATIKNGHVTATLNLPDAKTGYYKGTRFDWSGMIFHLESQGHVYFEPFYEKFDPAIRDVNLKTGVFAGPISAVSGPVDEFGGNDRATLGYTEAKPGGTFIKIGVGALRKPDEPRYDKFKMYEVVDPGKWSVKKGSDWIQFTQELRDPSLGYSYVYTKTVRLVKGQPKMILEHSLRNTGSKPIEQNVYNHNFFVIDKQPTGPDFVLTFPFEMKGTRDMAPLAAARGSKVEYTKVLGNNESAATAIEGFTSAASDNSFTIENRKTGAGVKVTGDKPLTRIYFWSVKTTLCPEGYIDLNVAPGQETKWNIAYDFYKVKN
jgi:hypothetical protein